MLFLLRRLLLPLLRRLFLSLLSDGHLSSLRLWNAAILLQESRLRNRELQTSVESGSGV
jgi:hypothetical protein